MNTSSKFTLLKFYIFIYTALLKLYLSLIKVSKNEIPNKILWRLRNVANSFIKFSLSAASYFAAGIPPPYFAQTFFYFFLSLPCSAFLCLISSRVGWPLRLCLFCYQDKRRQNTSPIASLTLAVWSWFLKDGDST